MILCTKEGFLEAWQILEKDNIFPVQHKAPCQSQLEDYDRYDQHQIMAIVECVNMQRAHR